MATNTQRYLFHIQGIKCTNCIAKIRSHIRKNHNEISNLKLNLSQSSMGFTTEGAFHFESLQKELSQMGFITTELSEDTKKQQKTSLKERRDFLLRLGVAGACTGNSMLVSFALYLGADQTPFKGLLSWAAFFFYLPIVLYSAKPMIENALKSLFTFRPSIDVPIALAIIVGGLLSLYSLSLGSDEFYFDSLSMLIFLILCTRFLVFSIRQSHLSPLSLTQFFNAQALTVNTEEGFLKKEIHDIKPGAEVLLSSGESLPFDSVLLSEKADFDTSILTGESYPQTLKKHDTVFAGSLALNNNIKLLVKTDMASSRFSSMLDSINQLIHEKNSLVSLTDRGAQILTYLILSVSFLFLIYPNSLDLYEKIMRILALLVIACPCALAIATPLALSLSVKSLFKKDILIKNLEAFALLKNVGSVVFDKTGTLTSGTLNLTHWSPKNPTSEESSIIKALENDSKHPIAKAILRSLPPNTKQASIEAFEKPGEGVFAEFQNSKYSITQSNIIGHGIDFKKDGKTILSASFESTIMETTKDTLAELKKKDIETYLLTGDKKEESLKVGTCLNFSKNNVYYEHTPEMKLDVVKSLESKDSSLIYVGDGLNDVMAMTSASVSVSVHSSLEETFKSSDVHFIQPGVSKILDLIQTSNRLYLLLRTNLTISFVYNVCFGALALSGLITPFLTAIIMPISSFLVVGLTFFMLESK